MSEERGTELLNIGLLGPPDVKVDGVPVEVDTRKAIALLAYLAVERTASRDTLATLFWAESSSDRARATLRRTLSSLRGGVGSDVIIADRHHIELAAIETDISRFEAAIEATSGHGHDISDVCPHCIQPLTEATNLYRGDFLEGFSVRDAPDFEDWERTVTEDLRLRAGEAFSRLGMAKAAVGDYSGAISAVTRWVELDSLHEPAHRLLMLLNAWAGDRPRSIEAYRAFVAILDRELGVTPLEETTELYEAILDEDLPPAPGMRRATKAEAGRVPAASSAMLDRAAELAVLQDALEESSSGGQVLSLTGASWMGKTRLMEELTTSLASSDQEVLLGKAFRMEQTLPYGVVTQLLHDLAPLVKRHPDELPEWAIEVASRLDPQLGGIHPPKTDAGGELRLFEGFFAIIEAVSTATPLVIVVDDLQWIDPASAQLIAYMARRIPDMPNLLLIVAARSGETMSDRVRDLLDIAITTIELEPLSADSISEEVDTRDEAARIITLTGGIPLLVLEEITGGGSETPGIARYLEDRLASIGDLSRQVLGAASVLTGVCDAAILRDTSGRTEEEIVEAVEELINAGVLREEPDDFGLSFTLDQLEDLVYHDTSLIRRRLLHNRAAAALEARPRSHTDARLAAVVASQHHGAGNDQAANWYHLAGDLAREVYANEEAKSLYENAIALGDSDVGGIRMALGELAIRDGAYSEATTELTAAAAHSEGTTLAVVEHRLGEVQRLIGRFDMAQKHYERSAELDPDVPSLFSDWALLHHRLGDTAVAQTTAMRALESARKANDDLEVSKALNILGVVDQDPSVAMGHIDDALDLAGANDILRMAALNNKAHVLSEIGNVNSARSLVGEAIEIASRTGYHHHEAALRNHLADLYHQGGFNEESRQAQTEAMVLFADIDAGAWEPELWLLRQW